MIKPIKMPNVSPLLRGDLGVCLIVVLILTMSVGINAQERSVEAIQIFDGLRKATSVYATQNHLYVVESGANRVLKLDHRGGLVETMGGLGSGSYQMDTPIDVDATNGLKIFISDSRNNRIQIFDRRFQYLTSIRATSRDGFARAFQPKQLTVNDFGEVIFYDETTKSFHRFNENGVHQGSFRLPPKVKEVTDIQSDGRMIYLFDAKQKQYHLISDNGLKIQSFPTGQAATLFVDEKGVEWAFTLTNMYDVRDSGNPVYWDYELNVKDATGVGNSYFLMTPNEIFKVTLPSE